MLLIIYVTVRVNHNSVASTENDHTV